MPKDPKDTIKETFGQYFKLHIADNTNSAPPYINGGAQTHFMCLFLFYILNHEMNFFSVCSLLTFSLQKTEQLQTVAPYHEKQYKGHIHFLDIVHPHPDSETHSHSLITDTSGDSPLFKLQTGDFINRLFRGSFSLGQGLLWLL